MRLFVNISQLFVQRFRRFEQNGYVFGMGLSSQYKHSFFYRAL